MGSKACGVCKEVQSKYKCPSCRAPYCSVACFKKHKEILCQKSLTPLEEQTATVRPARSLEVEEPSWLVNEEQLQSLAVSADIRDALKDEELRKLIIRIDSAEEPDKELDKAIQGQIFHEFTDKILAIVSPKE
ncbi:uncharacterized protein [Typha angustifolia]|uniref:uncharacterized protein isoform X2 n=1 Tax=Typha angustifolia TaxID=59011 RepID=UPI003C2F2626